MPGTLSDPARRLLFYQVDFPVRNIRAEKDVATHSVRVSFR